MNDGKVSPAPSQEGCSPPKCTFQDPETCTYDGFDPAASGSSEGELLRTSDPTVRVGARITVDGVTYDTTDPDTVMPEGIVTGSILGSAPSGKGTTVIIDRTRLEPFRYRRK